MCKITETQKNGCFFSSADHAPTLNKCLVVALEIIFGGACVGIGIYLAKHYGVGLASLSGIGGGGALAIAVIVISSLACMRKKEDAVHSASREAKISAASNPEAANAGRDATDEIIVEEAESRAKANQVGLLASENKEKVISGKIFISSMEAGALGKDLSLLFDATSKVRRVDSIDWKAYPNEMLVECEIYSLSSKGPLYESQTLYLPLCLFVVDNDYTKLKKEGNKVEFYFENTRYELSIAQQECRNQFQSLEQAVLACQANFYDEKKGCSLLRSAGNQKRENRESYLSPITIQKHCSESKNLKQQFLQIFIQSEEELSVSEYPVSPKFMLTDACLIVSIAGADYHSVRYFFNEGYFGIFAPKKKMREELRKSTRVNVGGIRVSVQDYPMYAPDHDYLFLIKLDDSLTREMLENGTKVIESGELVIKFQQ